MQRRQLQFIVDQFETTPWIPRAERRRIEAVLSRNIERRRRRLDAETVRRQRFRLDAMPKMNRCFALYRFVADGQLDTAQPSDELLHFGSRQFYGIRRVLFDDDMRIGLPIRALDSCGNRCRQHHGDGRQHRNMSVHHGKTSNFSSLAMTANPSALFFLLPRSSTVMSRRRRTSCV